MGAPESLVFSAGNRWDTMKGHCHVCGKILAGEALRGHVTKPFGKTFIVDAFGLCECGGLSRMHYRFPPDMTMVGISPQDGKWTIWKSKRSGWWPRLRAVFGF